MSRKENKLIIPVYLNQRIVFDLLATLQEGISTVTRVSSTDSNTNMDDQRYGAAFGLSQAFSTLLKIDISGNREKKSQNSAETQRSEERFHTPTSLLQQLREMMQHDQNVTIVGNEYRPEAHDIIEFTASLRRNPMIQVMDVMIGMMDMMTAFTGQTTQSPTPKKSKHQPQRKQDSPNSQVAGQMKEFLRILKSGDTIDIISDTLDCDYKAVITLEQEYLNDPTMSDLVDGQFKVLGKIIRVIPDNKQSISLIRKTPLSVLQGSILNELMEKLSDFSRAGDIHLPEVEWEITGPVIQVIPIAIFA